MHHCLHFRNLRRANQFRVYNFLKKRAHLGSQLSHRFVEGHHHVDIPLYPLVRLVCHAEVRLPTMHVAAPGPARW